MAKNKTVYVDLENGIKKSTKKKTKKVKYSAYFTQGEAHSIDKWIKASGASKSTFVKQAILNFIEMMNKQLEKQLEIREKQQQEEEDYKKGTNPTSEGSSGPSS